MGKIPYKIIDGSFMFCPDAINEWAASKPDLKMDEENYLEQYAKRFRENNPDLIKNIHEFSSHYTPPREPKGYYLEPVKNKKLGVVYYVKYLYKSKLVPSKWTTRTNDIEAAQRYAVENRERLITEYFDRKTVKKPYTGLYMILKKYYAENSPYLQVDIKKGRVIGDEARIIYHNFITAQFIPYLKKQGVKEIEEIDTPFMSRFRNYLMTARVVKGKIKHGIKPQSTKNRLSQIFDHLVEEGYIKNNPCRSLKSIKVKKEDHKVTGCYEVSEIKGVFNKKWENELSYLLSMLMYTTNMSNREIERIQVKDIIEIDKFNFIDIPGTKTPNRVRIVPLHPFVLRKIRIYTKKNKKEAEDHIFKNPSLRRLDSRVYNKAYTEMGNHLGYTREQLKKGNMRFYSGRHFWKTLMSSEGLGEDIEEVFMGHRVSSDVAKRYNHRDKQGKKKKLEKARKVLAVLDKRVFT